MTSSSIRPANQSFTERYKTVLILVLMGCAIAAFSYWNYSAVDQGSSTFFKDKAHREPYYAATKFLKQNNNATLRYIVGQRFLSTMQFKGEKLLANDTLFLSSKVRFSKDFDVAPLIAWMRGGGTLVVASDALKLNNEGRDILLDELGLYAEPASSVIQYKERGTPLQDRLDDLSDEVVEVFEACLQASQSTPSIADDAASSAGSLASPGQGAEEETDPSQFDEQCLEEALESRIDQAIGDGDGDEPATKEVTIESSDISDAFAGFKELGLMDQSSEGFFRYASGQQRDTLYFRAKADRWHYCRFSKLRHANLNTESQPLQSGFSMAVQAIRTEDDAGPTLRMHPINAVLGDNTEPADSVRNSAWSTVLELKRGNGRLVLLPGEHMFSNPLLPCAGNASFLKDLVAQGNSLWLIDFFSEPDFWDKLWRLVPYSVVLFLLAIIFFIWCGLARFGPAYNYRDERRRSFAESLKAKAAFLYRNDELKAIINSQRKRTLNDLLKRHMLAADDIESNRLTEDAEQALASRLNISQQTTHHAFNKVCENKRRSLIAIMRALQQCHHALGKSL